MGLWDAEVSGKLFWVPGNEFHINSREPVLRSGKHCYIYIAHFLQVDHDDGSENGVHILNFSCILEKNNEILVVIVIYKIL